MWPDAPFSSFISVSLAWGDRKPERPKALLLLFHISLLVTGLTSPPGTRGTERGWGVTFFFFFLKKSEEKVKSTVTKLTDKNHAQWDFY